MALCILSSSIIKDPNNFNSQSSMLKSNFNRSCNVSNLNIWSMNQLQKNSFEDCSRVAQHLSFSSSLHDLSSSTSQISQQMLHPHQLVSESQNNLCTLSVGSQSKSILLNQWPQSQDGNHIPGNMSHEQQFHVDFHQRISGEDEAQCNNLSSDGSIIGPHKQYQVAGEVLSFFTHNNFAGTDRGETITEVCYYFLFLQSHCLH